MTPGVLLAAVAVAMAPDLDLLAGSHRTYTHSIGATAIVAVVCGVVLGRRHAALSSVLSISAAHSSHVLFDWLGKDSSRPPGLTALWPFSTRFFVSGLDLFGEVSRRYWLPEQFILGNLQVLAWELFVLVPICVISWIVWSNRTVRRTAPESRPSSLD
jgi:membrane-bound metal-dependent hydrolase YbcI (DUF457 family)